MREQGESLTVKETGAVVFFKELIARSVAEEPLVNRFREVLADALRFSLLDDVGGWRAARVGDLVLSDSIVSSSRDDTRSRTCATTVGRPAAAVTSGIP